MNQIWKRYFLVELFKVFTLFIFCFYFLYVLIDYSAHTKIFHHETISYFQVVLYYLCQFSKRADILFPFAMLVATIKVLTSSNLRNEIVALVTGGIAFKKLLNPFVGMALFLAALLYLNFQLLQPNAINQIKVFEEHHFKERSKEEMKNKVNALRLEDYSLFIYGDFNKEKGAFYDVFWLKSLDELYRIHSLFPYAPTPYGKHVDTLKRSEQGEILKTTSEDKVYFPEMKFDKRTLFSAVYPPSQQSLTQLVHNLNVRQTKCGMGKMNDKEAEICTYFFYKLTIPFVSVLVVCAIAPFCLRTGRHLPIFFIYALSIFGMISFFTVMNSSVILAQSQVGPPFWIMLIPQMLFYALFGWNYAKV